MISKKCQNENFMGALTQLYARGPEDQYEIGTNNYDTWSPWPQTIWNNPSSWYDWNTWNSYYPYSGAW